MMKMATKTDNQSLPKLIWRWLLFPGEEIFNCPHLPIPTFGRLVGMKFVVWNYKNNSSLGFLPSQHWQSTVEKDMFPYCKLQCAQINSIHDQWQNICSPEDISQIPEPSLSWDQCYWRNNGVWFICQFLSHCTPCAGIPDFLRRLQPDWLKSASTIKQSLSSLNRSNPIGGAMWNCADAVSILLDTHKVTNTSCYCIFEYCWQSCTYRLWKKYSLSSSLTLWISL